MWGVFVVLSVVSMVGGASLTAYDLAEQQQLEAQQQTPSVEVQQIHPDTGIDLQILPGETQ